MVDTIRVQIMEQMANKREVSNILKTVICQDMDKRLDASIKLGRPWTVRRSSETVYDVLSYPLVIVDIYNHICSVISGRSMASHACMLVLRFRRVEMT